jgi:multidrug efflux pump subunit AcrA (membrane-fusion protein)
MSRDFSNSDRTAVADRPHEAEEPVATEGSKRPQTTITVDTTAGRSRNTRVLLAAVAGLVVVVLVSFVLMRTGKTTTAPAAGTEATAPGAVPAAPVPVSTARVAARELPRYLEATGSLIAWELTDVAPRGPGRVAEIYTDVGATVRQGQPLARLETKDDLIRIDQAKAQLAQAEANARQARERLGVGPDGKVDPTRVAEVQQAKAQLDLAESNERRYRSLVETGDVSQIQYDEFAVRARTAREQYEAAVNAARSSGAAIDVAEAAAQAARAQLALAQKMLADATIVAPFDGNVTERPAAVGEWLTTSSKVATLVRTDQLKFVMSIAESDAGLIRLNMPVKLRVDSFPDREFAGVIVAINPSLDSASRALQAIVGLRNPEALLRPGMFGDARIVLPSEGRRGIAIPAEAVTDAVGGAFRVFVIRDGRAESRVVTLGTRDEGFVQVVDGLQEGEDVAIAGIEKLTDGAPVVQ